MASWIQALTVEAGQYTHGQPELSKMAREALKHLPASTEVRQMVRAIYLRSGIEARHFELPIGEGRKRSDWLRAVNEACVELARRTLRSLFAGAPHVTAGDCDGLVVVSSSFSGFPGFSRQLQENGEFPMTALTWDLTGLGCAGPTQGLDFASMLLESGRCERVCLLFVDVMGTYGQLRQFEKPPELSEIVAHCLASDAGAAMVLGREPGPSPWMRFDGGRLETRLWSGALDQNDLNACELNQPYLSVGKAIRTRLIEESEAVFAAVGEDCSLLMHPGGPALMERLALARPDLAPTVGVSQRVLREHGNIGAASLIWVLTEALEEGFPLKGETLLFALGPGIVSTSLWLKGVEIPLLGRRTTQHGAVETGKEELCA